MKYYLIAGEASGDLHGARLVAALHQQDPAADIRAWGGDLMQAAGATLVKHYRDLAFMGFTEVVRNLPTIMRNFRFCREDIAAFQPDVVVLIDYPGFNLRMAKWAKKAGLRVFYYISPQIWAWHTSRVKQIKAYVDRMFVILPFEEEFYARYGVKVDFVGHPLLDVVDKLAVDPNFRQQHGLDERPIIALLPGSRRQEIERLLPGMLATAANFPEYQMVVAGAPAQEAAFYQRIMGTQSKVALISGHTYALLQQAQAALVTSGTATLETALFGVPQIVCYKGSPLSYYIARRVIQVKYISLVNLIADAPIVPERIQTDCTPAKLTQTLSELLQPEQLQVMQAAYVELRQQLGDGGAAHRTAKLMVQYLGQPDFIAPKKT